MKKIIGSLFCLSVFLLMGAGSVQASKITIELKNGNSIEVGTCWEDADNFHFYWRGGLVGISKNAIDSIQETIAEEALDTVMNDTEAAACLEPSDEASSAANFIIRKYTWGKKDVKVAKTPQGHKIEFSGSLMTTEEVANALDSFKIMYTDQFGEIISEKTIRPDQLEKVKESDGIHEYRLTDSQVISSCPSDVEVYVTRYK